METLNCNKNDIDKDYYIHDSKDSIIFSNNFNRSLEDDDIINSLKTIKSIYFGSCFDHPIDCLPNNIEKIIFDIDSVFNQQINNLPVNLKEIYLGNHFNQPVNCLPSSLTKIIFGISFNQSLDNLPNGLEELVLGIGFLQKLENLPSSIKKINIFDLYPYITNIIEKYKDNYGVLQIKIFLSRN